MSVRMMAAVWEHSEHKGSELLVLLALADNADDDGIAFPGYEFLAGKTRMSSRGVQYVVRKLLDSGELELLERGRKHRSNRYRVSSQSLRRKPSQIPRRPASSFLATAIAPEPSGNRHIEPAAEQETDPAELERAARIARGSLAVATRRHDDLVAWARADGVELADADFYDVVATCDDDTKRDVCAARVAEQRRTAA